MHRLGEGGKVSDVKTNSMRNPRGKASRDANTPGLGGSPTEKKTGLELLQPRGRRLEKKRWMRKRKGCQNKRRRSHYSDFVIRSAKPETIRSTH